MARRKRNPLGGYYWMIIVFCKQDVNKSMGFQFDDKIYKTREEAMSAGKRVYKDSMLYAEGLGVKIFTTQA